MPIIIHFYLAHDNLLLSDNQRSWLNIFKQNESAPQAIIFVISSHNIGKSIISFMENTNFRTFQDTFRKKWKFQDISGLSRTKTKFQDIPGLSRTVDTMKIDIGSTLDRCRIASDQRRINIGSTLDRQQIDGGSTSDRRWSVVISTFVYHWFYEIFGNKSTWICVLLFFNQAICLIQPI